MDEFRFCENPGSILGDAGFPSRALGELGTRGVREMGCCWDGAPWVCASDALDRDRVMGGLLLGQGTLGVYV